MNTILQKINNIIRHRKFTFILSIYMAIFLSLIYPHSCMALPRTLGLLFQNQVLRAVSLIIIIYIAQYNYYLSFIITFLIMSSFLLDPHFENIPMEGFKNKNNDDKNINDDKSEIDTYFDKDIANEDDTELHEDDFIDLDDNIEDSYSVKEKVKEKFQRMANKTKTKSELKDINQCIDLISKLPGDNDNTYRDFLQSLVAQRKAYVSMIKGKKENSELTEAKEQYYKMLRFLIKEFLVKIGGDEDEEDSDDE